MLIRNKNINKGPKSVVTHIGTEFVTAVHPDFGAFRIYAQELTDWEN
jgi:hypothetical protein